MLTFMENKYIYLAKKKIFCEMDNSSILHHDEIDTTTIREGGESHLFCDNASKFGQCVFSPPPRVSRKDFQNEYVGDKSSGETLQALTKIFMTQSLCLWVWGDKRSLRNLSKF